MMNSNSLISIDDNNNSAAYANKSPPDPPATAGSCYLDLEYDETKARHQEDVQDQDQDQTNISFDAMVKQATNSMLALESIISPTKTISNSGTGTNLQAQNPYSMTSPSPVKLELEQLELYSLDSDSDNVEYSEYGTGIGTRDYSSMYNGHGFTQSWATDQARKKRLPLHAHMYSTTHNPDTDASTKNVSTNGSKILAAGGFTYWFMWSVFVVVLMLAGITCIIMGLGLIPVPNFSSSTSISSSPGSSHSSTSGLSTAADTKTTISTYWSGKRTRTFF